MVKKTSFLAIIAALAGLGLSVILSYQPVAVESLANQNRFASQPISADQIADLSTFSSAPIIPIPTAVDFDPAKVALGDRLFHDTQLSHNNQVSCASCHRTDLAGTDGLPKSIGFEGLLGEFNAPTVLNSSFNFRQFWDGRAATLTDQINGPISDPEEMNSSWSEIVSKLKKDKDYAQAFRQLYSNGIQPDAIRDAIATYEQTLITPNARFDQYLQGDQNAITAEEKSGYQLFSDYGCVACHQGVNVGGNMFQRLGIMKDFFADRGNVQTSDLGRMNISGRSRDRYVFKVPTLRNIELTAPYLHDGSVTTLDATIEIMAEYQLGREIPQADVNLIIKFLRTLTGDTAVGHTATSDTAGNGEEAA